MKKFNVEIKEELVRTIEIEANSQEEAYTKARKSYFSGKVFDNNDVYDVTYLVREA